MSIFFKYFFTIHNEVAVNPAYVSAMTYAVLLERSIHLMSFIRP